MNRQIETDRFTAGLEKLGEIDGKAGQEVICGLQDIAPDLGKYIIEFAFGDIYTRNELDLKERESVTLGGPVAPAAVRDRLVEVEPEPVGDGPVIEPSVVIGLAQAQAGVSRSRVRHHRSPPVPAWRTHGSWPRTDPGPAAESGNGSFRCAGLGRPH